MGWLPVVLLVLAIAAALYPFARRDKGALQFLAAALLLALAGYSWQGHPFMAGSPKAPPEHQTLPDNDFQALHPDLLGRFDNAWTWTNMADGYQRRAGHAHHVVLTVAPHCAAVHSTTQAQAGAGALGRWIRREF